MDKVPDFDQILKVGPGREGEIRWFLTIGAKAHSNHNHTANPALFFFIRWHPYWTQVSVSVIEVKKAD